MNDIRALLKIAARRLETGSFLSCANVVAVAMGLLVVLLMAAERVGARTFLPWWWLLPALAAAGLVAAAWAWRRRRRTELQVALAVDERLDLREKLSTALHCAERSDPFARAAVDDAVSTARDAKVREMLRRRFAVESPRRWWLSPLVVALAGALYFVPALDLFAAEPQDDAARKETQLKRDEAVGEVIKRIQENPRLRDELTKELGELAKEGPDPDAIKTREEIQRDAIKKLTDLNKKLDDIVNGEQGKTAESIERALEQLKTPQEGPGKELAEAMAKGDFKAAKEALAKLQKELEEGKLTEEQKKQLAEQLGDIAAQLEALAQQQQQLEAALQQAGLNPQLAKSPQALQEAIAKDPNLTDQQKQQLQQMSKAQQSAQQMCRGLGSGLSQMGQGIMQGQMGQSGKLGEQLSQLEAMQQLLREAQAVAGTCQGQCKGLGQGLSLQQAMALWSNNRGGAFGNRGQGAGGKAPIAPTPVGKTMVKSPTKNTGGDVIAREFIDGPVIVGESQAQIRAVSEAVSQGYDEAQADEQIPPKYWEAHMHYFGELRKRVEAVKAPPESPKSPESPASGGKDEPAPEPQKKKDG